MMSTCSAGRGCRTSWPTPIPRCSALDFPVVPGNDESGVGRTIMELARAEPALMARPPRWSGERVGWTACCAASPSASLPVLVALYVGATTFGGGTAVPWRPIMVDLDVYRLAGSVLLAGGDFYDLPGPLQFLYPPFAAVLAVPLALLPLIAGADRLDRGRGAGPGGGAAPLRADRLGAQPGGDGGDLLRPAGACRRWPSASWASSWWPWSCLDLAPGPRVLSRRVLPEGALTGLAAAIKLTPAIFVVYLLAVGKRRAFCGRGGHRAGGDPGQRGDRAAGVVRVLDPAGRTATPGWAAASSTTRTSR